MFDIAWSELLLIAVIGLIFIGPKELPQVLHSLGRMTAKLRRTADDFRRQFEDSVREAGYEDLHKNIQEFRSLNPANQLKDSIARAINQDYTPKPAVPGDQVPAQPVTDHNVPQAELKFLKTPEDGDYSRESAAESACAPPEAAPQPQPVAAAAAEPSKERIAPAA